MASRSRNDQYASERRHQENEANTRRQVSIEQAYKDVALNMIGFGTELNLMKIMAKNRKILIEERRRGQPLRARPEAPALNSPTESNGMFATASRDMSSHLSNAMQRMSTVIDPVVINVNYITDGSKDETPLYTRPGMPSGYCEARNAARGGHPTGNSARSGEQAVRPKDNRQSIPVDISNKISIEAHSAGPVPDQILVNRVEQGHSLNASSLKSDGQNGHEVCSGNSKALDLSYLQEMGLQDQPLWPTRGFVKCSHCGTFARNLEGVVLRNCRRHRLCKLCFIKDEQIVTRCPVDKCGAPINETEMAALHRELTSFMRISMPPQDTRDGPPACQHADRDGRLISEEGDANPIDKTYLQVDEFQNRPLWTTCIESKCHKCTARIPSMEGYVFKHCQVHTICKDCFRTAIQRNQRAPLCPLFQSCNAVITEKEIAEFIRSHGSVTSHSVSHNNGRPDRPGKWQQLKKTMRPSKPDKIKAEEKSNERTESASAARNTNKKSGIHIEGSRFSPLIGHNEHMSSEQNTKKKKNK